MATIEPSATAEAEASEYPARTAVEVVSPIVARPGVPPELRDRYWWTENDAGEVGTTAQLGVPGGEEVQWAADGVVVSILEERADAAGYGSSRLIVRDLRSGRLLREISTSLVGVSATIASSRLFWAGMARVQSVDPASRAIDGGVWTSSIAGSDRPVSVVRGGLDVTALSALGAAGRVRFRVSRTGRTISSAVGGSTSFSDVIDAVSATRIDRIDGRLIAALTDDAGVAVEGPVTDAPMGDERFVAFRLRDQRILWRYPQQADVPRFTAQSVSDVGGSFVGQYILDGGSDAVQLVVAKFDPSTGTRRTLVASHDARSWSYAVASISTPNVIALSADFQIESVVGVNGNALPVSLLDVATGQVTKNAFVIDAPWLCYETFCRRTGP